VIFFSKRNSLVDARGQLLHNFAQLLMFVCKF
jgi:hypothetical protein